ncbi:hypothetical protein L3X38_040810 [Prunus dulcis]|uniref:Uncharacterized protein n=1 Tax=Prunus dulcis TaxID=3755 RepID=A0AAD4UTH5_PRUDU|nr:hypothetical protein L3X38_040810 [Prunus dulcis]
MVKHAPNSKYHIGDVKNAKSLLKTLPQSIDKANECQQDAWDIGYSVEELGNDDLVEFIKPAIMPFLKALTLQALMPSLVVSLFTKQTLMPSMCNINVPSSTLRQVAGNIRTKHAVDGRRTKYSPGTCFSLGILWA